MSDDPLQPRAKVSAPVKVRGPQGEEEIYVAVGARSPQGAALASAAPEPDPEELAEAAHFAQSLADHGRLAWSSAAPAPGATHELEEDEEGHKHLKRRGFAAIPRGPA